MALTLSLPCRCSHARAAHEHYRRGTDCSACDCTRYARRVVLTLTLGRVARPVAVVVPDEVASPPGPAVRPTHAAGHAVPRPGVATPPPPRTPAEPSRFKAPTRG